MNSSVFNFSNNKEDLINNFFNQNPLCSYEKLILRINQTPDNYNISLMLKNLEKNPISLSYENNFLIIEVYLSDSPYMDKETHIVYLKDISLKNIEATKVPNLVYIKIPKVV